MQKSKLKKKIICFRTMALKPQKIPIHFVLRNKNSRPGARFPNLYTKENYIIKKVLFQV